MNDLHNNEKYASLNREFTTKAEKVDNIYKGVVMLYGSDTIVIFYKDFETTYSYTPVGRLTAPEDLEKVVGLGQIETEFEVSK